MQVDPMKPKLKPPGTKRLRLKCDILLSTSAFKFNLRRYTKDSDIRQKTRELTVKSVKAGWCDRLKPALKAPGCSA